MTRFFSQQSENKTKQMRGEKKKRERPDRLFTKTKNKGARETSHTREEKVKTNKDFFVSLQHKPERILQTQTHTHNMYTHLQTKSYDFTLSTGEKKMKKKVSNAS